MTHGLLKVHRSAFFRTWPSAGERRRFTSPGNGGTAPHNDQLTRVTTHVPALLGL